MITLKDAIDQLKKFLDGGRRWNGEYEKILSFEEELELLKKKSDKSYLSFGTRHVQAFLLFIGMAISEAVGVALSVGIVAMTDVYNMNAQVEIFDWDKQTQDIILSSFLWGFAIMQIPAGALTHNYGGKRLLVVATFVNGISSVLLPWSAHVGGWQAVCACRVIQGLAQAVFLPALATFLGKWAPVNERSRFSTYVYGGGQFGTVVSMFACGFLSCSSYGWPAIFYTMGFISIVFAGIMQLFCSDSPAQHKTISIEEKSYIQSSLRQEDFTESLRIPWTSILTSVPVWATIIAHIGFFWGYVTLLAEIPSYIHTVLKADILENGILSALPYIAWWAMSFLFSYSSDYFIAKEKCSITTARKVVNTISTWVPALGLIVLSFVPGSNVPLAVFIMIITIGSLSGTCVGFTITLIDVSPNFAGTLMSISCFFASLVSIMTPITAGFILTDSEDPSLWRIVFMIASGMLFVTNLVFILFGSADTAPWNEPQFLLNRNNSGDSIQDSVESQIDAKPE